VLLGFVTLSVVVYVGLTVWALASRAMDGASFMWLLFTVPMGMLFSSVLAWRRPGHPIGELLLFGITASLLIPSIVEIPTVISAERSGTQDWMWLPLWVAQTATVAGVVAISALIALLPDGRAHDMRERALIRYSWPVVLLPTLALISNETIRAHSLSFPGVAEVPAPFVVEWLLPLGPAFLAATAMSYVLFLVGVVFQIVRYRRAPLRQRKQVRWVLYAGVLTAVLGLVPFLLSELGVIGPLSHAFNAATIASAVAVIGFPAAVDVAVLEPAWLDVDIVIRKSFVYGALSFVILALYVAVASALGVAAGQRLQIEVAIFLTVIVAVMFQPARRWLQELADRWVFGERPTRYQAVTEFGETIGSAGDPAEVLPRMAETIRSALRLVWVRAELIDGNQVSVGQIDDDVRLTVSIANGSEVFGTVTCGPKLRGSLDSEDQGLVEALASQVALAIANARLAGRIVTATEEERRRIERNIHDGAQQELVALVAKLGMIRGKARQGAVEPGDLDELQEEAQRILSDLRDLAQGIHPSVLTDGGILEAVEERCSHLPLEIVIDAPPAIRFERFSDDIEGAAYFFVVEALTNVMKHASASRAWVTISDDGTNLTMAVRDDGTGFDPGHTPLNGLAGLTDRVQALGGSVRVVSSSGSGTKVNATLPIGR
jgi:signal transduction histidine kinase